MRTIDYLRTAGKDLGRQRVRSSLTIVALTISTAVLIAMAAVSLGGRRAIVEQISPDDSLTTIVVTPNQSVNNISPFGGIQRMNSQAGKLDDSTVAQLAKLPHVQAAVPEAHIWEVSSFAVAGNSQQFVAQVNGLPDGGSLPIAAGSSFGPTATGRVAVIGYAYAKALGYGTTPNALVGKTLALTTQKGYRGDGANIPGPFASPQENEQFNQTQTTLNATIIGVTKPGGSQNGVFIPLTWARAVRTQQYYEGTTLKTTDQLATDGYTAVLVRADTTATVGPVAASITKLGYGEISTLEALGRLQQISTVMWVILGSVSLIAVIAAALGVVNTMLMAVSEQRYTIGVWRACGATKGSVARQFMLQAGYLGCIGGTLGSGLGLLVAWFVNQRILTLLQSQGLSLTNVVSTPLWLAGGGVLLATLFGILAGLYPARQAARQDPALVLSTSQ